MIRCEQSSGRAAPCGSAPCDDALPQALSHGIFQSQQLTCAHAHPYSLHRARCNAQRLQRDRHQCVAASRHRTRWRKRLGRASIVRLYDADSAGNTVAAAVATAAVPTTTVATTAVTTAAVATTAVATTAAADAERRGGRSDLQE
jgi:hypothetical protein